jgi:phenylacetate-CoA ligase
MGPCECGRFSPYLEGFYGREADFLVLPSGKRVSPYLLTMSVEKHPEIRKYQLVQLSPSELRIDVVCYKGVVLDRTFLLIEDELRDIFKEELKIHFRKLDQIPSSKSGKFQIVSRHFS